MTDAMCATGCGRPSPSAALCAPCTTQLRSTLELAATLEEDLDDAAARLLRHGGSSGKSASTEAPLPVDLRAVDAAGNLRTELATAIHVMLAPRAWSATDHTITGMARWLLMHTHELTRHARAGTIATRIRDAVARCVRVLEPPAELHPAGSCKECGARLLAEAGADAAECRCGHVTTGLTAARAERAAAADVLGTATEISGALAMMGIGVPRGTITSWASRGRLHARPGGKYALSDVLALVSERDNRVRG